jgi:hypothetical protein
LLFKAAEHRGAGCATAAFAGSPPGIVAQPPFSMKDPCCQVLTFFNSIRFEAASALC